MNICTSPVPEGGVDLEVFPSGQYILEANPRRV